MNERCRHCQQPVRLEGSYWRCPNCNATVRCHELDALKLLLHKILTRAGTHMVDISGPCLAFDYAILNLTEEEDHLVQRLSDP